MGDLTTNLSRREFKCPCILCDELPGVADFELVSAIQGAVDHFSEVKQQDLVVIITSANRCKEYNKKIGGAPRSRHTQFIAADMVIAGVSPEELAEYFDGLAGGTRWGIGVYPEKGHVHLDMRETKARW